MIEPGEIYFVKKGRGESSGCEIKSGRPGIVISSKEAIACQGTVNIVYITSSSGEKQYTVNISDTSFTHAIKQYNAHTALCGQIHAVDKGRLGNYLGKINGSEFFEITKQICRANQDFRI